MSTSMIGFVKKARTKTVHSALIAGFIAIISLLAGCADKDKNVNMNAHINMIDPPNVLYNQALINLDSGHFEEASKKFTVVEQQYPYSEWARKSLIMGASSNYQQNKYDEAINMAKRYVALYPNSNDASYAYYIIGLSYFRQMPDITRDQKDTSRAITAMQEVVNRYPHSKYIPDAKVKIRFAREQLASKEMQVGRYYLERRQYLAALRRFRLVVKEYSNTREIEEALYRLVEVNYAMGLTAEAETAAYMLRKNYPKSSWCSDAYKVLRKSDLSLLENRKEWLSSIILAKIKNEVS
ncbi:MAG: outer membrane protein assembly factor BamD [Candidatus Tokpelaia sp. JSC188]|nr:MAG: outer membrane protein assembly factor BamD [Candidatus Tokpelaia sp. JSC188]